MMGSYLVPGMCGLAFLVGLSLALNPITDSQTFAITEDGSVSSSASIAISLPDIDGNEANQQTIVTPGEIAYRTNTVQISTAKTSNYQFFVRAAYGHGSELRGSSHQEAIIQGVGENVFSSDFRENTWGYAVSDNVSKDSEKYLMYNTLPNSDTVSTPDYSSYLIGGDSKELKIAFAARISGDWPGDHYQTKVYLSAVAIPTTDHIGFNDVVYMQDMTPEICRNATVGTTKQLIDNRVGQKKYWVTKLLDGNCWMTQDLALDLSTSVTLTVDDSDVGSNWKFNGSVRSTPTSWTQNGTSPQVYIPGPYVRATPTSLQSCSITSNFSDKVCDGKGWTKVDESDGWVAATTPVEFTDEDGNISAIDIENKVYDAHYLIGNYYNWYTATANSGSVSTDGGVALSSICPKNWKLPLGGYNTNDTCGTSRDKQEGCLNNEVLGSFNYLFKQYSLNYNGTGVSGGMSYILTTSPIYAVSGGSLGAYNPSYGLQNAGNYGFYWSAVARNTTVAYGAQVSPTSSIPSRPNDKADGNQVRCMLIAN